MSEHRIGKFLKATQEPTDRDGWRIHNNRRQLLGVVDYEPHWREYVFNLLPNTCYSQECCAIFSSSSFASITPNER